MKREENNLMANIGENREPLWVNVPRGCKEKFDQLMHDLKVKYPEAKRICQDRGVFLDWLLDHAWTVKEEGEKASVRLAELRKREEELAEYEEKLNQKNRQLTEIDNKLCEQLGLLPHAKDLWLEAVGSKIVSKEEILSTLKILKESGIKFEEVVQVIRREDLPGFLAWARQVKEACLQGAEKYKELSEDIEALKRARTKLQEEIKSLAEEYQVRLSELDRATLAVAQACAAARDVGLYVDYIKQACQAQGREKITDLLPMPATVIAGTILEAAASAYGDRELVLVPGPKHPLPIQVTVREIARSLAPAEAYREQQKAQLKAEAKAEAIAAGQ
jgi:DNA repair exonuclease SbcCD ATPase subunit